MAQALHVWEMFRICFLSLMLCGAAQAQTYTGQARVVDGDTVDLGLGANIRLHGIDTPELSQRCDGLACGKTARAALVEMIAGRLVRCEQTAWDNRYNRPVARCFVGKTDLGAGMVAAGYARAYLKYSADYAELEKEAALNARGFWAGTFTAPAAFRAAQRQAKPAQSPVECVVKGNISPNSGERIYHVAGQRHYENVVINTARGETCFATEAQARAAGWRKARR